MPGKAGMVMGSIGPAPRPLGCGTREGGASVGTDPKSGIGLALFSWPMPPKPMLSFEPRVAGVAPKLGRKVLLFCSFNSVPGEREDNSMPSVLHKT